jgi:hypothetical protein
MMFKVTLEITDTRDESDRQEPLANTINRALEKEHLYVMSMGIKKA